MEPRTSCVSEAIWMSSWVLLALIIPMLHCVLLRHPYEHPELYTPYYGPFFYWWVMANLMFETSHFIAAYRTNPGRSYTYFVRTTHSSLGTVRSATAAKSPESTAVTTVPPAPSALSAWITTASGSTTAWASATTSTSSCSSHSRL